MMTETKQPESDLPKAIGRPATNALHAAGYYRLEQLDGLSAAELLKIHGVGPKAVRVLGDELAARGRSLRP